MEPSFKMDFVQYNASVGDCIELQGTLWEVIEVFKKDIVTQSRSGLKKRMSYDRLWVDDAFFVDMTIALANQTRGLNAN